MKVSLRQVKTMIIETVRSMFSAAKGKEISKIKRNLIINFHKLLVQINSHLELGEYSVFFKIRSLNQNLLLIIQHN